VPSIALIEPLLVCRLAIRYPSDLIENRNPPIASEPA
jgi:hypothetical protein